MTEPLSRDQVNAALAKHYNWKFEEGRTRPLMIEGVIHSNITKEWLNPETQQWVSHPPDYCGEWNDAGPLLLELSEADWIGEYGYIFEFEGHWIYTKMFNAEIEITAKTYTEAIARADLAWLEAKETEAP